MTEPGDPVLDQARQLHAAGASAEQVRKFLLAHGYEEAAPKAPTGHAGKPFVNAPEMANTHNGKAFVDALPDPSYLEQAAGGVASLARDIPGAEALQAGARAAASHVIPGRAPTSYRDARQEIRDAEDTANPYVRNFNRLAGGTIGALATPGGAVKGALQKVGLGTGARLLGKTVSATAGQGASFGALSALGKSDPDAGVKDRAVGAAKGAAIGGVVGATVPAFITATRGLLAPNLAEEALAHKATTALADEATYGKAGAEGDAAVARGPLPRELESALNSDHVRPFFEKVQASEQFGSADLPTQLRETYKLMSRQQSGLQTRINIKGQYDADLDMQAQNIAIAKRRLLDAAEATQSVPRVTTAQSPNPSLRQALDTFDRNLGLAVTRKEGTVAQQMAKRSLDRHITEVSPTGPVSGEPPVDEVPVMGSLRPAIKGHADAMGEARAGVEAQKGVGRVYSGKRVKPEDLTTKSGPAFRDWIKDLEPASKEAGAARASGVGEVGERLSANPITSLYRSAKTSPYLDLLDQQADRQPLAAGAGLRQRATTAPAVSNARVLQALGLNKLTPNQ